MKRISLLSLSSILFLIISLLFSEIIFSQSEYKNRKQWHFSWFHQCMKDYKNCKEGNSKSCKYRNSSKCRKVSDEELDGAIDYYAEKRKKDKEKREKWALKRTMPGAVKKDRAIESQMRKLTKERLKRIKKVLRVVIYQDWEIHRHLATGAIKFRQISGAIAYKNRKGDCYFVKAFFMQEYKGNGKYGRMKYNGNDAHSKLLCKNVNK
jgi:hypothetical protein